MELREIASIIWKWLWLIVLAGVVAAGAAWWVVKDQPPLYHTSTTLMIGQAMEKANPNWGEIALSEQLAQTYAELVRLEPILRDTARALGSEELWQSLRGQVSVEVVPGTLLMKVSAVDTDPLRAQLIANEVARQLVAVSERTSGPLGQHREFLEEQLAVLPPKIEAARAEIRNLEASLAGVDSARQMQSTQDQIDLLNAQTQEWQRQFEGLAVLLGEGATNTLSVVEEASMPVGAVSANWMLQVLLAAATGAGLATGAAFLIEYLDDTLKSPTELSKATGLTTLGSIGRISGNGPPERLVTISNPRSPVSEAYRALRTNLRFSAVDDPVKSLVITSASPLEGKSTTAANLGVAMAQTGKSVVLVDGDLRRPSVHKIYGAPNREGLTNALLDGEGTLDDRLQKTAVENLRLLTSGPLPPNPAELLGTQKMAELIEELRGDADVVIFDTPPSLVVTDAAVLGSQVDGVLLVTRAGRTRKAAAKKAAEQLQQTGAHLVGTVLNWVPMPRSGYDSYQHYYNSTERKSRSRWRLGR